VLDEQGTPIPGLLAACADFGDVFVWAYAGGIANALIFNTLVSAAVQAGRTLAVTTPPRVGVIAPMW
jgi:hypothetical protein